jgi:Uncharacterized protein conserved in bacteria (DUF2169)
VLITPLGRASAATLAFRVSGQLHVAAIVKATFVCAPEQAMLLVEPAPIAEADPVCDGAPGKGVLVAGDLVPYRPRADVLLSGHARAPAGRRAQSMGVRLMVARGQALLLDKHRAVPGPHGAPIDGGSPAHRAPLGDPRVLEAPIPELPADFPWTYFQAAPEDQRIDFLQGDEWVGFEGMNVQLARVQSYLPRVRGAARVYRPGPEGAAGKAIALVADTLRIDADRLLISVVWRGSFAVSSEVDLGGLHVVAGVEMAGVPLEFPSSVSRPPASAREHLQVVDAERHKVRTVTLVGERIDAPATSRAGDVLPFKPAASAPRVPRPAIPLPPATPFERHAQAGVLSSRAWTPTSREDSTPIPPAQVLMMPRSSPLRDDLCDALTAEQAPSTLAPSAEESPHREAPPAPRGEPEAQGALGQCFLAAMGHEETPD